MFVVTNLPEEKLEKVKELERSIGHKVIALSQVEVDPATVSSSELDEIKHLEAETGLTLVAVD